MSHWHKFEDYLNVLISMMPLDEVTQAQVAAAFAEHRIAIITIAFAAEDLRWRTCAATDANAKLIDCLEQLAGEDD